MIDKGSASIRQQHEPFLPASDLTNMLWGDVIGFKTEKFKNTKWQRWKVRI